jgi:ABC-type Fe3+ transport system permease subunit
MLGKMIGIIFIAVCLCVGVALMLTAEQNEDGTAMTAEQRQEKKAQTSLEENVATITFWVKFWSVLTILGILLQVGLVVYGLS